MLAEAVANRALGDERPCDLFVIGDTDLLEGMRERIVPHVVQQGGGTHHLLLPGCHALKGPAFIEQAERHAGEMPRAERMFEA